MIYVQTQINDMHTKQNDRLYKYMYIVVFKVKRLKYFHIVVSESYFPYLFKVIFIMLFILHCYYVRRVTMITGIKGMIW